MRVRTAAVERSGNGSAITVATRPLYNDRVSFRRHQACSIILSPRRRLTACARCGARPALLTSPRSLGGADGPCVRAHPPVLSRTTRSAERERRGGHEDEVHLAAPRGNAPRQHGAVRPDRVARRPGHVMHQHRPEAGGRMRLRSKVGVATGRRACRSTVAPSAQRTSASCTMVWSHSCAPIDAGHSRYLNGIRCTLQSSDGSPSANWSLSPHMRTVPSASTMMELELTTADTAVRDPLHLHGARRCSVVPSQSSAIRVGAQPRRCRRPHRTAKAAGEKLHHPGSPNRFVGPGTGSLPAPESVGQLTLLPHPHSQNRAISSTAPTRYCRPRSA